MKKSITNAIRIMLLTVLAAMLFSGCNLKSIVDIDKEKAEMQKIFDEDWEDGILGEFDTDVTLGGKEYHISSTSVGEYDESMRGVQTMTYEISVNGDTVLYDTDDKWHMEEAYIATVDGESVILFVLPITHNGYQDMTAYRYSSESGFEQLSFDYNGDGVSESKLEPGRHCYDFEVTSDGTFKLVTGTRSIGMWGLKKRFRLDENDVLTFEKQDKYETVGWGAGYNPMTSYDKNGNKRAMTFEEAQQNIMYGVETEKDYEMLQKGYYACKQSFDDLKEGDYFQLIYDDNNGNVMFKTSEGKTGWVNVNDMGYNWEERIRIGGFAFALAG